MGRAKVTVGSAIIKTTKSGKRLQKDPNRPKKPRSAYLYFADQTRDEVMKSNPGLAMKALMKLIGQEWGKLKNSQKTLYEKQAAADKDRYAKEMKKYKPSAEYLEAQKAFKEAKKGGTSAADAAAMKEELGEAKSEVKDLKKQVKELEKQTAKQEKLIEKLEAKLEKAKAAPKPKAKAAPKAAKKAPVKKAPAKKAPAKKAPAKKKEAAVPTKDAHYVKYAKKMLGKSGEGADKEVVSTMKEKGVKGVAKLLTKRYKSSRK